MLRSSRFESRPSSLGLGRRQTDKINKVMDELKVPDTPVATKAVCDVYDELKRNVLVLLTLEQDLAKLRKKKGIQPPVVVQHGGGKDMNVVKRMKMG